MFLPLPLSIWLSLVLAGLAFSACGFSLLLCMYVSTPGRPVLSRRNLGMDYGTGSAPGFRQKTEESCLQLSLGSCVLMALGRSILGQEFEQKWWSYLCSQVCQHSWETSSFLAVFGYGELWHRVSFGHCGTGSALGAEGNGEDPVPGCSLVPVS